VVPPPPPPSLPINIRISHTRRCNNTPTHKQIGAPPHVARTHVCMYPTLLCLCAMARWGFPMLSSMFTLLIHLAPSARVRGYRQSRPATFTSDSHSRAFACLLSLRDRVPPAVMSMGSSAAIAHLRSLHAFSLSRAHQMALKVIATHSPTHPPTHPFARPYHLCCSERAAPSHTASYLCRPPRLAAVD